MATGITENDVWAAADALLLEGARPTIERVRQKIGRGSPNTVSPYLETWFRALGARIKDPGAFAAAPAIPDPVAQAATHFWEAALAEARAQQADAYAQRYEALTLEAEQLAGQAEQLQQRETQLEKRERDLQEALRLATAQLSATEDRLQAAEQTLRQRDTQLKHSTAQLEDARAAVQTLLAETEKLRAEHAQALEAAQARHAAHERRWLNELDAERSASKKIQLRLDEAQIASQRQAAALQASLSQAQEARQAAELEARRLSAELHAVQQRVDAAGAAADEAVAALREREGTWERRIAASEAQSAGLLLQLKQKDEQLADLTRHLLTLAQQNTVARGAGNADAGGEASREADRETDANASALASSPGTDPRAGSPAEKA